MKNFRKVLALVLVVATLFSFAAMASAKYEDAEDISYVEAVTVLSQIGILNGYEVAEDEYEFKPENTITREEMAKMIAVLANAGSDVSKLYASANAFADVENDRWSASYIAYCAQTGIVAGRTADTFDPYGKVTGLETAKMLLVVLGFDAQEQGYVGANWKINVLRDAKVMGLLNNFAAGYDVEAAITREEAAQMMLNALEAPCVVGVLSDSIITVTNALVFDKATISAGNYNLVKVETFAKLKDALKAGNWALYGNVVISDDLLCEKLYDLERTTDTTTDCYGRPATSWTYTTIAGTKKTFGIPYANAAIFTSANTSAAKVEAALAAYEGETAKLYVDGLQDTSVTTLENALTALETLLGKGVQLEVFYANGELTFVVINTFIARIDQVNTATHTVDFDAMGLFAGQTATMRNFNNVWGLTPADAGKVVLVWQCNKTSRGPGETELHDLKVIEPIVATVSDATTVAGNIAKSTFTADGKAYEYAKNQTVWGYQTGLVGDAAKYIGEKVDIYTDLNGFVMVVEKHVEDNTKYAVIDNKTVKEYFEYNVQNNPVYSYTASLINFEENAAPGEAVAVDETFYAVDHPSKCDTLVKYDVNADGTLKVVNAVTGFGTAGFTGTEVNGTATLSKFAAKTTLKAITDETQILLRVYDFIAGKHIYKYFDGKSAVDATYDLTHAQYFTDDNGYITYLYAEAKTVAETVNAFILGYAESTIYIKGEDQTVAVGYDVYDALINGEPAKIAYAGGKLPFAFAQDEDYFSVYTTDAKYIGISTIDGEPIYVVAELAKKTTTGAFTVKENTVKWDTGKVLDLAADAKIIVAFRAGWDHDNDKTNDDLTYTTVSSNAALNDYIVANGWKTGRVWAYDTDGDDYTDVLYILAKVDADAYGN